MDPVIAPDIAPILSPGGVLRVAVNLSNTIVVQHTDEDTIKGLAIELSERLASALEIEPRFLICKTPAEAATLLSEDKTDLSFLAVTPERAATLLFTSPYIRIEGTCLVRDAAITSMRDLDTKGVTIACMGRTGYTGLLEKHLRAARMETRDSWEETIALYEARRVHAVAGIRGKLEDYANATGEGQVLPDRFGCIDHALAVNKTRESILHFLSAWLEDLSVEGFVAASLERSGEDPALCVSNSSPTLSSAPSAPDNDSVTEKLAGNSSLTLRRR